MTSDTSARGFERLICTALNGSACDPAVASGVLPEDVDEAEPEDLDPEIADTDPEALDDEPGSA